MWRWVLLAESLNKQATGVDEIYVYTVGSNYVNHSMWKQHSQRQSFDLRSAYSFMLSAKTRRVRSRLNQKRARVLLWPRRPSVQMIDTLLE